MSQVPESTSTPRREMKPEAVEFGVAAAVLSRHPETLTEAELITYVSRGRPELEDRIYEAIRELISTGVLQLEGDRLHASGPAVHLARISEIP